MTRLVIRYRGPGAPLEWLVEDERGRVLQGPNVAEAPAAAALAGAREIVVLVPSGEALLAEAKLAARAREQIARAIPYALEDQLAEPVEALHFAYVAAGDAQLVAYVRAATLRAWRDDLAARGIEPDVVAPVAAALPLAPGRAAILVEDDEALVRTAPGRAFVVPRSELAGWLALAGVERAADGTLVADLHDASADGALQDLAIDPSRATHGPALAQLARGARTPLPNLLSGAHATRHRGESARRAWRTAAMLAGAALLLAFGHAIAEYAVLSHQHRVLSTEIEKTYRAAFPATTRITANPRGQMEGELRRLRSGAQGDGPLALLARVAPTVTAGTQHRIEGIEYRNGTLELEVQAPAVAAIDALRESAATVPGLHVELAAATSGEDGATGRLRIREGAP